MGLKVSTTCELTFGEQAPGRRLPGRRRARGHQADVHDHRARPHDGRHEGDRHAVHRLPQRARVRQGARAGRRPDQDGGQDRAARAPSPTTPTYAASSCCRRRTPRACGRWCSTPPPTRTRCRSPRPRASRTSRAEALNDLLLPIVKGVGSERSYELLARVAADPRRLRLPAGLPDRAVHPRRQDRLPVRGHDRDPGPGPVLPQDPAQQGRRPRHAARRDQGVRRLRGRQRPAQGGARSCSARPPRTSRPWSTPMAGWALGSLETPKEVYKVGLNTTRFLLALGDLVIGWLLLRQAEVALAELRGDGRRRRRLLHRQGRRRASSSPRPCCPAWPPSASVLAATGRRLWTFRRTLSRPSASRGSQGERPLRSGAGVRRYGAVARRACQVAGVIAHTRV